MPIPTRGRHHTPSLLFATVPQVDPPRIRLIDEDLLIPVEWIDEDITLIPDSRVLVAEVAPKQWAIVSVLSNVRVV